MDSKGSANGNHSGSPNDGKYSGGAMVSKNPPSAIGVNVNQQDKSLGDSSHSGSAIGASGKKLGESAAGYGKRFWESLTRFGKTLVEKLMGSEQSYVKKRIKDCKDMMVRNFLEEEGYEVDKVMKQFNIDAFDTMGMIKVDNAFLDFLSKNKV